MVALSFVFLVARYSVRELSSGRERAGHCMGREVVWSVAGVIVRLSRKLP